MDVRFDLERLGALIEHYCIESGEAAGAILGFKMMNVADELYFSVEFDASIAGFLHYPCGGGLNGRNHGTKVVPEGAGPSGEVEVVFRRVEIEKRVVTKAQCTQALQEEGSRLDHVEMNLDDHALTGRGLYTVKESQAFPLGVVEQLATTVYRMSLVGGRVKRKLQ